MAKAIDGNIKNETDYLDYYNCCRLCWDTNNLHELFAAKNGGEELLRKILICTSVKIERSGDEEAWICSGCISKIEEFYQYREQCRANDIKYQNWNRRVELCNEPAQPKFIPLDDSWGFKFVETDDGATDNDKHESCASSVHTTISISDDEVDSDVEIQDVTDGQSYDEEMDEPRDSVIGTKVMKGEKQNEQPTDTLEAVWNVHPENRWVKSNSGRMYLFRQGFLYWQRKEDPTVIVANGEWYCINDDCEAKLQINGMIQFLQIAPKHDHASPLAEDSKTRIITQYLNENVDESTDILGKHSQNADANARTNPSPSTDYSFVANNSNDRSKTTEVTGIHNHATKANSHTTHVFPNSSSTAPSPKTDTEKRLVKMKIITWKNYRFRKQNELEGAGSMWVCTSTENCPAKLEVTTLADGMVKVRSIQIHNHGPTSC